MQQTRIYIHSRACHNMRLEGQEWHHHQLRTILLTRSPVTVSPATRTILANMHYSFVGVVALACAVSGKPIGGFLPALFPPGPLGPPGGPPPPPPPAGFLPPLMPTAGVSGQQCPVSSWMSLTLDAPSIDCVSEAFLPVQRVRLRLPSHLRTTRRSHLHSAVRCGLRVCPRFLSRPGCKFDTPRQTS
jgi:hypothetical protein